MDTVKSSSNIGILRAFFDTPKLGIQEMKALTQEERKGLVAAIRDLSDDERGFRIVEDA